MEEIYKVLSKLPADLVVDNPNEILNWTTDISRHDKYYKTIRSEYQNCNWREIISKTILGYFKLNQININQSHFPNDTFDYEGYSFVKGLEVRRLTEDRKISENDILYKTKFLMKDFIFWYFADAKYLILKVFKKNLKPSISIETMKELNDTNKIEVVLKLIKICSFVHLLVNEMRKIYQDLDKLQIENENLENIISLVNNEISPNTLESIEKLNVFKCFEYAMDDDYFKFTGSEYNQVSDWDHFIKKTFENYFDFYKQNNVVVDRNRKDQEFRPDFVVKFEYSANKYSHLLFFGEEKALKQSNKDELKNAIEDLIKKQKIYENHDYLFCYAAEGSNFQLYVYDKRKKLIQKVGKTIKLETRTGRMNVVCMLINICRILHAKIEKHKLVLNLRELTRDSSIDFDAPLTRIKKL